MHCLSPNAPSGGYALHSSQASPDDPHEDPIRIHRPAGAPQDARRPWRVKEHGSKCRYMVDKGVALHV